MSVESSSQLSPLGTVWHCLWEWLQLFLGGACLHFSWAFSVFSFPSVTSLTSALSLEVPSSEPQGWAVSL